MLVHAFLAERTCVPLSCTSRSGERARNNTMVLVEEVADGGRGIAGDVLTLVALGEATPADPGGA